MTPNLLWHCFPLGLVGADQLGVDRAAGRGLSALRSWLGHAKSVGADTIMLGPVFESLTHGYDTVDHRSVDQRLGSTDDLLGLITDAAERDIGLVLDGAFAYASREFWRLDDPSEAEDPWFVHDEGGALVPWRVDSLITPDYGSSGYQTYVAEVMTTWLDRGVAGWRLDSAWSVPPSFWRRVLARVRQRHPGAWLVGQVFDDDLPRIINSASYSSVTEYALMHGIREWLAGGDGDSLRSTLALHQRNSSRQPVHTFVGNHDFARLADVVGTDRVVAAHAMIMTLPGVPAIYYGDEFGLTSTWLQGGSDALLRPSLQPADALANTPPAREISAALDQLGQLRRRNPWLATGTIDSWTVDGDRLDYRVAADEVTLTVEIDRLAGGIRVAGPQTEITTM